MKSLLTESAESQHAVEACSSYQKRTFWEQQGANNQGSEVKKETIIGTRWDGIRFAATHEVTEWTETKPGNEEAVNLLKVVDAFSLIFFFNLVPLFE